MSYGYFQNYISVLLLLGVLMLLAGGMLLLSYVLGTHRPTRQKLVPFECGVTSEGDAHPRFSMKFFRVAVVFLLFIVAMIFLYPWAVIFYQLRMYGFLAMLLFLMLLTAGYIYLWRKGVFDWSRSGADESREP
jgi:NADH-quinone oxidoreductase subunit A